MDIFKCCTSGKKGKKKNKENAMQYDSDYKNSKERQKDLKNSNENMQGKYSINDIEQNKSNNENEQTNYKENNTILKNNNDNDQISSKKSIKQEEQQQQEQQQQQQQISPGKKPNLTLQKSEENESPQKSRRSEDLEESNKSDLKNINPSSPTKQTPENVEEDEIKQIKLEEKEQYEMERRQSRKQNEQVIKSLRQKQGKKSVKIENNNNNLNVTEGNFNSQESTKYSINQTTNESMNSTQGHPHYQSKSKDVKFKDMADKVHFYKSYILSQPSERAKREQRIIFKEFQDGVSDFAIPQGWGENYGKCIQKDDFAGIKKIQNMVLFEEKGQKIRRNLKSQEYILVNETQFYLLQSLYGGGPAVKFTKDQIKLHKQNDLQQQGSHNSRGSKRHSEMQMEGVVSCANLKNCHLFPFGLENQSFYCYMNACVQCLLCVPQLNYFFNSKQYQQVKNTKKNHKFVLSHAEIVQVMYNSGKQGKQDGYLDPVQLKKFSRKVFEPSEQHDSQEFLRYLLSEMQDELTPQPSKKQNPPEFKTSDEAYEYYFKYHPSIIDKLFAGQLQSSVKCTMCNHISSTFDPFLDLSVPIQYSQMKQQKNHKKYYNGKNSTYQLNDCLEAFFEEEDLCDDYKCEKCKKIGKARRQIQISKTPKYLVIHLKRFKTYPYTEKIKNIVEYPYSKFDIQNYTVGNNKGPTRYNLIALVEHSGTPNSGHYFSFGKREGS